MFRARIMQAFYMLRAVRRNFLANIPKGSDFSLSGFTTVFLHYCGILSG
jgi:hypothetical protein